MSQAGTSGCRGLAVTKGYVIVRSCSPAYKNVEIAAGPKITDRERFHFLCQRTFGVTTRVVPAPQLNGRLRRAPCSGSSCRLPCGRRRGSAGSRATQGSTARLRARGPEEAPEQERRPGKRPLHRGKSTDSQRSSHGTAGSPLRFSALGGARRSQRLSAGRCRAAGSSCADRSAAGPCRSPHPRSCASRLWAGWR